MSKHQLITMKINYLNSILKNLTQLRLIFYLIYFGLVKFASLFSKGKYSLLAVLLFATFIFRLCFLNVSFINSFNSAQAKALTTAASCKRNAKPVKAGYPQYSEKTEMAPDEVSEESVENDTSENLVKNAKYPSLLFACLPVLGDLQGDVTLRSLVESFNTKLSSRTYLSISVLRI